MITNMSQFTVQRNAMLCFVPGLDHTGIRVPSADQINTQFTLMEIELARNLSLPLRPLHYRA
jgi:hypothetical protein